MVTTGASGVPLMGSLGRGSNTDIRIHKSDFRIQTSEISCQNTDDRIHKSERVILKKFTSQGS